MSNELFDILSSAFKSCSFISIPMGIKDVIFNGTATIVLWHDGTKTVVKCKDGEVFDCEKGLAMAICKKVLDKDYHKVFKRFVTDSCCSRLEWYDRGYDMGYRLGSSVGKKGK